MQIRNKEEEKNLKYLKCILNKFKNYIINYQNKVNRLKNGTFQKTTCQPLLMSIDS